MKPLLRTASSAGLLAAGFALGTWAAVPPTPVAAQAAPATPAAEADAEPVQLSEGTAEKIKQAQVALETAQTTIEQEGLYGPAIRGLNAYAVLSGGVDAVADLESGRGVDPVTFAGLHIGLATDAVAPDLGYDPTGRLTYKGKLVRIYSVDRMKRMNSRQAAVLGASEGGRRNPGTP